MPPLAFMILWCCGATLQGIVGVQTLLGRRLPTLFAMWYAPDEEAQRKAKTQTILGCCTMFVAAMGFIGKAITMLDTGETHALLAYNWHGLTLHYLFGAVAMVLGVGMLRTAFVKPLPRMVIPSFVYDHGQITKTSQEKLLTVRASLIVFGLLATEAGVLLSYFVASAK